MAKQGRKPLTAEEQVAANKRRNKYVTEYRKKNMTSSTVRFNYKTDDPYLLAKWDLISNKTQFIKFCVSRYATAWIAKETDQLKADADYDVCELAKEYEAKQAAGRAAKW